MKTLSRLPVSSGFSAIHHYTKMTVCLKQGESVKTECCSHPSLPETIKHVFAIHAIIVISYLLTLYSCQSCSPSPHEAAALLKDLDSAAWHTPPLSWMSLMTNY